MPGTPVEEVAAAELFYAEILPEVDVAHFAPMWHIFTVGHLIAVDLERIVRRFGVGIADLHLLGTLRIERARPLRATDLALILHVSTAVLSARVERLARAGLLVRDRSSTDKRAFTLALTAEGRKLGDDAMRAVFHDADIIRLLDKLPAADRALVSRILGGLHNGLDREFVATGRGEG
jgi:DNA-binding MarR family transcriptional regulator